MFQSLNNIFGRKPPQKGSPFVPEPAPAISPLQRSNGNGNGQPSYSKIFRWRLPDGITKAPATVEVVGSFNHWQKAALTRDGALDSWHITLHHIAGNRTHHYMLIVDGQPTYDKTCDGLAVPHGPLEEKYAVPTDKGPRVLMLFAQTK